MKRIIILSILTLVLLTGCTKGLWEKIDELDQRFTELETQLEQQNENIIGLHTLFTAFKTRDYITGITQLEGSAGYAVHFSRMGDIVIYHGTDARIPRVGIKRNTSDGNYYWTIQYGSNEAQYIINEKGSMIPAVGLVPLLKIEKGKFYISYDSRQTWQYLGEADGATGDSIFEDIIVTDEYVSFVTEDQEFRIPTYSFVQTLYQNFVTANQNISSLSKLINGLTGKAVYVTSVSDVKAGGQVVGSEIKLSNGGIYVIHDWIDSTVPMICPEKEDNDAVYYWAIIYSDGSKEWIRDSKGNRVAATGEHIEIPVVTPVLDETDNVYYWNSVAAGDTTVILDQNGEKVVALSKTGEFSVFKGMDNSNPDYLQLTLANGTNIRIPKIYTISFSEENLFLEPMQQQTVTYRVYGADAATEYTLVTQGGVLASISQSSGDVGAGTITVRAGVAYNGFGKVMLLVSTGDGSTRTMTRTINVYLPEGGE